MFEPDILTQKQRKALDAAFNECDANGDGSVNAEELVRIFKTIKSHISLDTAKNMVKGFDISNSGSLELGEFTEMMEKRASLTKDRQLRAALRRVDTDGTGCLTRAEMRGVLRSSSDLNIEEIEQLIAEGDRDGMGLIDYEEFFHRLKLSKNL